jgi:amidophosphoribosyltransferase
MIKRKREKSIYSNCGVFGIYNHPKASLITYYGLHALQHRGQESAGIVTSEFIRNTGKYKFNLHKGHGLVLNIFTEKILSEDLKGDSAIGHNRYSTTGSSDTRNNIQPLKVNYKYGNLALSHNGNLTNAITLRRKLQEEGTIFQTTTDSEIILHLIAKSKERDEYSRIIDAFSQIEGAYSICILTNDKLFAIRDPFGVRPFVFGKLEKSYIFASETTSLDIVNADYYREVEPGEIIMKDRETVKDKKEKSYIFKKENKFRHCIFEFIYFSRPDSAVFGERVDKVRRKIGKNLAIEKPPPGKDIPGNPEEKRVVIINVPDSSNTATLGYFNESSKSNNDIRLEIGLIRSHYVGRTFIQPGEDSRKMKVKTKFNIVKGVLENRKVVIVDDSIVRGNTSKLLIELIRKADPKEIHLRISSPPIISPCYYGMDFPSEEELIANRFHQIVDEIKNNFKIDSLEYLSIEKLLESVPYLTENTDYCTACFDCKYHIPVEKDNINIKMKFDD